MVVNQNNPVLIPGACHVQAPTITGKIEAPNGDPWCWKEWRRTVDSVLKYLRENNKESSDEALETEAKSRVKFTLPGPMTILDGIVDKFYGEEKRRDLIEDLINCINKVTNLEMKYFETVFRIPFLVIEN